jgi:hypothetical protein
MLALCFLPAGCLHWPGPTSSPQMLALFGGPEGYELVHIPALARIELYRLAADPIAASPAARRIGGALVVAGPNALDDATLEQVSVILRDAAAYDWTASPQPGGQGHPTVALRFSGVKKTIDLLFSFADNSLSVYEGDRRSGCASFAPSAGKLSALLSPPGRE